MASEASGPPQASWRARLPIDWRKATKVALVLVSLFAACAFTWVVLPELALSWTDRMAKRAAKHVEAMQQIIQHKHGVQGLEPDRQEADYWNAANAYWYAAGDLAYYVSAAVTTIGIGFTFVVVALGYNQVRAAIRQVDVATGAMRSSARQQQMRLLFDLDIALLENPEILALMEGKFDLDPATLVRAKSNAFGHAFLNACDTIYDYYAIIDRESKETHWPAWENQLKYYLRRRAELRVMARESIERGFYTEIFRTELARLLEDAEQQPDSSQEMPDIVVAEPDDAASQSVLALRELSDSEPDAHVLGAFYETVYVQEFPDPDERESLANMED
jgi:hypothetical protein